MQIEPVGFFRLECYLARILAALIHMHSDQPFKWQEYLIGYEPSGQTLEELDAIFGITANGDHHES